MNIKGTIKHILEPYSGVSNAGKEWSRRTIVIETEGQFPKLVAIEFWGDKVIKVSNYKVGDFVECSIDIQSRENNGNWYTSVTAWSIASFTKAQGDQHISLEYVPPIAHAVDHGLPTEDDESLPF
jgi:hypothetical protein